jgi:predicted nuclease of predicted toxin-antitoxin system
MKILLDENLPTKIKYNFGDPHDVSTIKDMGWLGKKNGELLGLAAFNNLVSDSERFVKSSFNLGF